MDPVIMFKGEKLKMFRPASVGEINDIITKFSNKSRDLDSLPTWLLEEMCGSPSVTDNSHYQWIMVVINEKGFD